MPADIAKRKYKTSDEARPLDFISASELARQLRSSTTALWKWVRQGLVPPPWSRPGKCKAVWRRDHYEEFVRSRKWPDESWKEEAS